MWPLPPVVILTRASGEPAALGSREAILQFTFDAAQGVGVTIGSDEGVVLDDQHRSDQASASRVAPVAGGQVAGAKEVENRASAAHATPMGERIPQLVV